jgi:polyisoprenoid-binding protein YceI
MNGPFRPMNGRLAMTGGAWGLVLLLGAAGAVAAEPEVFVVDPEASRVRIHLRRAGLLKFLGHDHVIDAPLATGRIEVDPDDPTRSLVDLRWSAPLLAVVPGTEPEKDVPEVEARMRGPEVLHVEQHPGIRFWSFEIRVEEADPEAGLWRLHVRGGLELKGARHTVEVPLEVRRDGNELVTTGEVKLRLRRLGVEPPSVAGVVKVSDEFRVAFEVRARRDDSIRTGSR